MLAAVGLAAASAMLAAGLWWADTKANQLPRVAVGGTLDPIEEIAGEQVPLQARNFLVVGADSTSTLPPDDPLRAGRSDAQLLTDTLMILRVDPITESATLLSIPRDLWVRVSPGGYETKINAVLALGGSEALIATVQETFGIPINHYVEADFQGFRGVVDAVDGVPVYFPFPMRDAGTGFVQLEPGCSTLEPDDALAYVRSRRMEGLVDGLSWTYLDEIPDFGRITRQQGFVEAALERAIAKGGLRHPGTSLALVDSAIDSVTLDDVISRGELIDLMNQFQAFQAKSLQTFRLPATFGFEGELSVLYVNDAAAAPMLSVFRGLVPAPVVAETASDVAPDAASDGTSGLTPAAPVDPLPDVTVRLVNGSGDASLLAPVARDLTALGVDVVDEPAAEDEALPAARTTVRHLPGLESEAEEFATALGVDGIRANFALEVEIEITIGADFAGVGQLQDYLVAAQATGLQTADVGSDAATVPGARADESVAASSEPSTPSCV